MPSLVEIGPVILEKIFIFRQRILLFRNYVPLGKGVALHLNKAKKLTMRSAALLEGVQASILLCGIWVRTCRMDSTTVTVLPVPTVYTFTGKLSGVSS